MPVVATPEQIARHPALQVDPGPHLVYVPVNTDVVVLRPVAMRPNKVRLYEEAERLDATRPPGFRWRGAKCDGGLVPWQSKRCCQARYHIGYEHLTLEKRPRTCRSLKESDEALCKDCGALHASIVYEPMAQGVRLVPFRRHVPKHFSKLPLVYRIISKSLMQRLSEMEQEPATQLQLRTELNLYRVSADEAISMFGATMEMLALARESLAKARERGDSDHDIATFVVARDKARDLHDAAGETMRSVLKEVRDCALDAAKIEAIARGGFTASGVKAILVQATKLLYDVCGEENVELAQEFETKLNERIRVTDEMQGTLITPDMDVREMDDTVPLLEESRA